MKVGQLMSLADAECLCGDAEVAIVGAYTSDLLSDVMGNAPEDSVLITIQAHQNTVAVSTLAGVVAILVCNTRPVPDDMLGSANEEGIAIVRTSLNQFEASVAVGALLID